MKIENKYVAFIDVLGFTSIVNSDNHTKIAAYFDTIKMAFQIFNTDKSEIEKLIISDSIILIANDSDEDFRTLLQAIQSLQKYFALSNIWVRGGVAFGEVFFDKRENFIVGKGYIKAFLLEKEAVYPRVIIDPSILSKLGLTLPEFYLKYNSGPDSSKLIHEYLDQKRQTPDDAIFVCYADRIIQDSMLNTMNEYQKTPIKKTFDYIKLNLYGPQQHYHKYLWLKKYFFDAIYESYLINSSNDLLKLALTDISSI